MEIKVGDWVPPKDIKEARIRLINGEQFKFNQWAIYDDGEGLGFIQLYNVLDDFYITTPSDCLDHISEWLPYTEKEEKEPEFPFKDGDKVLVRDLLPWSPAIFCVGRHNLFYTYGDSFPEITAFDSDLVGTHCKPKTPVWVMGDGKPEMLKDE